MKKRFLAVLLAFLVAVLALPITVHAESESNGYLSSLEFIWDGTAENTYDATLRVHFAEGYSFQEGHRLTVHNENGTLLYEVTAVEDNGLVGATAVDFSFADTTHLYPHTDETDTSDLTVSLLNYDDGPLDKITTREQIGADFLRKSPVELTPFSGAFLEGKLKLEGLAVEGIALHGDYQFVVEKLAPGTYSDQLVFQQISVHTIDMKKNPDGTWERTLSNNLQIDPATGKVTLTDIPLGSGSEYVGAYRVRMFLTYDTTREFSLAEWNFYLDDSGLVKVSPVNDFTYYPTAKEAQDAGGPALDDSLRVELLSTDEVARVEIVTTNGNRGLFLAETSAFSGNVGWFSYAAKLEDTTGLKLHTASPSYPKALIVLAYDGNNNMIGAKECRVQREKIKFVPVSYVVEDGTGEGTLTMKIKGTLRGNYCFFAAPDNFDHRIVLGTIAPDENGGVVCGESLTMTYDAQADETVFVFHNREFHKEDNRVDFISLAYGDKDKTTSATVCSESFYASVHKVTINDQVLDGYFVRGQEFEFPALNDTVVDGKVPIGWNVQYVVDGTPVDDNFDLVDVTSMTIYADTTLEWIKGYVADIDLNNGSGQTYRYTFEDQLVVSQVWDEMSHSIDDFVPAGHLFRGLEVDGHFYEMNETVPITAAVSNAKAIYRKEEILPEVSMSPFDEIEFLSSQEELYAAVEVRENQGNDEADNRLIFEIAENPAVTDAQKNSASAALPGATFEKGYFIRAYLDSLSDWYRIEGLNGPIRVKVTLAEDEFDPTRDYYFVGTDGVSAKPFVYRSMTKHDERSIVFDLRTVSNLSLMSLPKGENLWHTTDPAENSGKADIEMTDAELFAALNLDDDTLATMIPAHVYLNMEAYGENSAPSADLEAVKESIGEDEILRIYDLTVNLDSYTNSPDRYITETGAPLKIGFTLEQSDLDNAQALYLVRVHNGRAEKINLSINAETLRALFESDKFSTYALVRTLKKPVDSGGVPGDPGLPDGTDPDGSGSTSSGSTSSGSNGSGSTGSGSTGFGSTGSNSSLPATGGSSHLVIGIALLILAAAGIVVVFVVKKRSKK